MTEPREVTIQRWRDLLAIAEAASPGPWSYNSYSAIVSVPLLAGYDEWVDFVTTERDGLSHSLERYGTCAVCGSWLAPHLIRSPGLGDGCRLFDSDYERDPLVATVPAHHGDTATDRHQADAKYLAAFSPDVTAAICRAALKQLRAL